MLRPKCKVRVRTTSLLESLTSTRGSSYTFRSWSGDSAKLLLRTKEGGWGGKTVQIANYLVFVRTHFYIADQSIQALPKEASICKLAMLVCFHPSLFAPPPSLSVVLSRCVSEE